MSWTDYPNTYQPEGHPPGLSVNLSPRPQNDSIIEGLVLGAFELRNQGPFLVELSLGEGASKHLEENFEFISSRLEELIIAIVSWADSIRQTFEVSSEHYDKDARLQIILPVGRLGAATEWSVWLHEEHSGWLVDLQDEVPVGGQGVF